LLNEQPETNCNKTAENAQGCRALAAFPAVPATIVTQTRGLSHALAALARLRKREGNAAMTYQSEPQYLRERAKRLREIAQAYKTEISPKLIELARDLETRAEKLEK
jgi:hypothetical protein